MHAIDHTNGQLLSARAVCKDTQSKNLDASTGEAPPGMPTDAAVRRALRGRLPSDFGRRRPLRLGWLALAITTVLLHLAVTQAVLAGNMSPWWMALSLPIAAFTWPCFFFTLHELGHGALLPPGRMRRIASAFAAFPILLQPTLWTAVHNHHHRFANHEADLDRRRILGDIDEAAGILHDFSNPFVILTLIAAVQLVFLSQLGGFLSGQISLPVQRRQVVIELVIAVLCTIGASWLMGWQLLLCGWLPCAMAGFSLQNIYLITNHMSRPMTRDADSLGTTVSVQLLGGWSHMDFGRHVEHHLFPHVSHDQLAAVTASLRERYPARFHERSLLGAVRRLFELPGYYLSANVLTDRSRTWRVTID
ncbi:MAG: hypothetical protein C5B56_00165 [Proteobacteria bacterium]|nr:MAG: hypothetical protein C5B56_00165 [Pseudomonadota bacterium]